MREARIKIYILHLNFLNNVEDLLKKHNIKVKMCMIKTQLRIYIPKSKLFITLMNRKTYLITFSVISIILRNLKRKINVIRT